MKETKKNAIATAKVVKSVNVIANDVNLSNKKQTNTESKKSNYATTKAAAILAADSELRGFNANKKAWQAAFAADPFVRELFAVDMLNFDLFTVDYLKANLPLRFNSQGVICQIKKNVEGLENVSEVEFVDRKGVRIALIPQTKWTALQFYNLFKTARQNELKAQLAAKKAAESAKKEAEKLEKAKARLEAMKTQVAKLESSSKNFPFCLNG